LLRSSKTGIEFSQPLEGGTYLTPGVTKMNNEDDLEAVENVDIREEASIISRDECFVCYILEMSECDCAETR
jgi:hypothetical protein